MCADFTLGPGGNLSGKKSVFRTSLSKWASFLPSRLFPFSFVVLTVLENDVVKRHWNVVAKCTWWVLILVLFSIV